VVNASTNAVLTTISISDPTQYWTSAYDAATDTMFIDCLAGYLEAVEFSHTTPVQLTLLLWLTPTSAVLVLGGTVGVLAGALSLSRRVRS
jgi:hypothetical protein